MPGATRLISLTLGLGAALAVAGAAAWWLTADRSVFYSDGDAIRAEASSSSPRDILWRPPVALGDAVNSSSDEREPAITADGDTMYFSRTSEAGDSDLFISSRVGNTWGEPRSLGSLNTLDNEITPRPSPEGAWLYFASDRPGSAGGFDIYRAPMSEGVIGEPVRLPMAVNTAHDEAWPTLLGEGERILFSTNRPVGDTVTGDPLDHGYSLFRSDAQEDGWADATPLDGANSPSDDLAPSVSPVGDYVYFASSREGSVGGLDLYRFRVTDGEPIAVESLGPDVNTEADETDPAPTMDGFAIVYASDAAADVSIVGSGTDLYRIVSREVVLSRETRFGDWTGVLALIPWILLALALVLLLALLSRMVRGGALSTGLATLGLMARCLLVSLVLHAALLALLSVLHMQGQVGDEQGGTRVVLTSSSVASSIAAQISGEASALEVTAQAPPAEAQQHTLELTAPSSARANLAVENAQSQSAEPLQQSVQATESIADVASASRSVTTAIDVEPAEFANEAVSTPTPSAPASPTGTEATLEIMAQSVRGDASESPVPSFEGSTQLESVAMPVETLQAGGESLDLQSAARAASESEPAPTHASVPLRSMVASLPEFDSLEGLALPAAGRPSERAAQDSADDGIRDLPVQSSGGAAQIPLDFTHNSESASRQLALSDIALDSATELFDHSAVTATDMDALPDAVSLPADRSLPAIPAFEIGYTDSIALPDPGETLAIEEPDAPRLRGLVLERETRNPIAGASVNLDREGASDLSVLSGEDGSFEIIAGSVPDQFALTATKRGYVAGSLNVSERDVEQERTVVILLDPFDPYVIAMEESPRVHHLGNDEFSGRVNSQFQRKSEGTSLAMTFELSAEDYDEEIAGAKLVLFAKGVQIRCPVLLNGHVLPERLPDSPTDGSFEEISLTIPLEYFKGGLNTLEIQTAKRRDTDIDDFEFVNVRIVLKPSQAVL